MTWSKSINGAIQTLRIEREDHVRILQKLEAFPPLAKISTLDISFLGDIAPLQALLNSEAADARLSTVTRFCSMFSKLDKACCKALKALLPNLCELDLNRCEMHGACMPMLVPELQLCSLELTSNSYYGVSASETVAGLAIFKNLETLRICTFEIEELPISKLTGLQLKTSELRHCFPVGINDLLQAVPLQNLKLTQEFILPPGMQFTSTSLQTLCIDTLSPSVCAALVPHGLPNLRYFQTLALDVSSVSPDRIEGMISKLAEFPQVLCSYDWPKFWKLRLYGCSFWSFDRSMSVLQAVSQSSIFKVLSPELVLYFNDLHWNLHSPGLV